MKAEFCGMNAFLTLFGIKIWLFCYWGGWVKIRGRGKIKLNLWYFFNKKDVQKDSLGENRFYKETG